jgi:hypothetical protein
MNEIQLLASYSPIYKQLWTSLARCSGCLVIFPDDNNNNDDKVDDDNNKDKNSNSNDNNINNISSYENAKTTVFIKIIHKNSSIQFSRRYNFRVITTKHKSSSTESTYLNITTGLSLIYNKYPIINNRLFTNS